MTRPGKKIAQHLRWTNIPCTSLYCPKIFPSLLPGIIAQSFFFRLYCLAEILYFVCNVSEECAYFGECTNSSCSSSLRSHRLLGFLGSPSKMRLFALPFQFLAELAHGCVGCTRWQSQRFHFGRLFLKHFERDGKSRIRLKKLK